MSGMYEHLREYARRLAPRGPVPGRLEVGALVHHRLKELGRAAGVGPWNAPPLDAMFGVSVVPREDLEPGEWRLLDTDGAEMQSGRLRNDEGDPDATTR